MPIKPKYTKQDALDIFENAITWVVVLAMYIYGFLKLRQFKGAAETDVLVKDMTGLELMWAFYAFSKPFIITLGALEVIGGTLLLFKRTRVLGCLFVSTILINIILQDYFYEIPALRAALWYQFLILIILWLNKARLIKAFKALTNTTPAKSTWLKVVLALLLFVIIRVAELFIT